MFGLSKKNKEKKAKTHRGQKELNKTFTPTFGTAEDFAKLHAQEEHIIIGRYDNKDVSIAAYKAPCNDIFVINNNRDSIGNQCVIPIISQGKLSYVVYDPNGEYHKALADKMNGLGYDIQVVDFADKQNGSRIDLFESANITRNTYWLSVMLASFIKCNDEEASVAYDLFMAMMQYLIASKNKIDIEMMKQVFDKIKNADEPVLEDMYRCPYSRQYILKVSHANIDIMRSVCAKIDSNFFKAFFKKAKAPNVFAVTSNKKRTVTFIKQVPNKYRNLVTIFLFNLKTANVLCGDGSVNTLLIDTSDDNWYTREILNKVCEETGSIMSKGTAIMTIRDTIDGNIKENKDCLLIYMETDNKDTKEYVHDCLKVKNQLSDEEREEISRQFFDGKEIPNNVLNSAPIAMEELNDTDHCIIIDTSKAAKALRCDRLK